MPPHQRLTSFFDHDHLDTSLSAKPALMQVVSLQIINMMTQEMYQGDRGHHINDLQRYNLH